MEALSQGLKYPLHRASEQLLGECLLNPTSSPLLTVVYRITEVALAALVFIGSLASIPLWLAGEVLEVLTPGINPFAPDIVPLSEVEGDLALHPVKTRHVGVSISTYQNTSNPHFCERSNWGRYNATHFIADRASLAPGRGVDILTSDGREQICRDILGMNGNTLRFSVEMTDVINPDGTVNEEAMQRYVDGAGYVKACGITPIITLSHFVHAIDERGRDIFENPANIERFVSFTAVCYQRLKDHVDTFITFNEANVSTVMNYVMGEFPAGEVANIWKHTRVLKNMLAAHSRVYDTLHELAKTEGKEVLVGLTHQAICFQAASRWNIPARIACFVMTYLFHESFMRWAEQHILQIDRLGVQYYTRPLLGNFPPDSIAGPDRRMVESLHFRFDPRGILPVLESIARRMPHVPLLVTETGTAGVDSLDMRERRREYYQDSVRAVLEAQRKGHNIIGYLGWSLYGNFEWAHGFSLAHDFGILTSNALADQIPAYRLLGDIFARSVRVRREDVAA